MAEHEAESKKEPGQADVVCERCGGKEGADRVILDEGALLLPRMLEGARPGQPRLARRLRGRAERGVAAASAAGFSRVLKNTLLCDPWMDRQIADLKR